MSLSENWNWPDDWSRIDWSREPVRMPSRRDLTPREHEILYHVARGLPAKTIGHKLGISEQTIKNHLCSVRDKLDVQTTMAAVWKMRKELEADPAEMWIGWGL